MKDVLVALINSKGTKKFYVGSGVLLLLVGIYWYVASKETITFLPILIGIGIIYSQIPGLDIKLKK